MWPRGYRTGRPVDLGAKSMITLIDIRTSRVYVNPGVSICSLVSYGRHIKIYTLWGGGGGRRSLTLGFIVNKSSVFAVDNRLSMSATVMGGAGPEFRSTDVAAVVWDWFPPLLKRSIGG